MKLVKKIFIIPAFVFTSVAIISSSISCSDNKFLVTFHAGDGHTINSKNVYAYKTDYIEYNPAPDDKLGTEFLGWKKNKELEGDYYTFPLTVTQNLDFYACYKVSEKINVVSFNTDEGSSVPNYNVNEGDAIQSEPQTSKQDYVFNGWKLNKEDPECIKFPFTPNKDTILYASWTHIDKYDLTFHTNGGTAPKKSTAVEGKSYTYKYDEKVKEVVSAPTSTKENHNLEGWYLDEGLTNRIDFTKPLVLTKNLDIYAKWELITTSGYTVTLLDEDKTTTLKTISNTTAVAYEPEPGITKEGYTFDAWYDFLDESKVDFTGGPVTIKGNTTWHAKWVKNEKCAIKLVDVDNSELKTISLDKGSIVDSPFEYTSAVYKQYGDFIGWKSGEDLISYPYTVPSIDKLTLTASVDINSCNINIYDSESTSTVIKSLGNVKSINSTPKVYKADRMEDYVFDHLYYLNSSSEQVRVDIDNDHPFVVKEHLDLISSHEIKLYAAWNAAERKYTVTLKYGNEVTPTQTVMEHQKKTIAPKDLIQVSFVDGYISAWKEEGGTIEYPAESTESLNLTKDTTFEAVWTYTHRTLKVVRIDGTTDTYPHQPVKTKLSDVPKGSKSYCETIGYKVDDSEVVTDLNTTIDLKTDANNPTTLTEVFTQTTCELTINYYDSNGNYLFSKVIDNQPLSFNLSTIPVETYQDHALTKYNYNSKDYSLTDAITLDKSDDYKAEMTAIYTKNAFTVTFDYKDEASTKHIVEHCSKLTSDIIPTPTRTDYRFNGWVDKDNKSVSLLDLPVTEDVTYYATWVSSTTEFTVTFSLGSYQAEAKFADTTARTKAITGTDPLTSDNCPKPTCEGCAFLGWYISEKETTTPTYPLTTTQTLYARFAPLYGYSTICLNLLEDGKFSTTSSSSTLLTVVNGTTWQNIVSKVPTITFSEDFKVSGWSKNIEGTNPIGATEAITKDIYLYSIVVDDEETPSSFTSDNWPTLCSLADQGYAAMTAESSAYYAQWVAQGNTFVGLEKTLKYAGTEYKVKVVGCQQDYGDSAGSTKLPLTFEFEKVITDSVFNSDSTVTAYDSSDIKTKLNKGGIIYNSIALSLTKNDHISTAYKYTAQTYTACQLFLPSMYEINVSSPSSPYFRYTGYQNIGQTTRRKYYDMLGEGVYCPYWLRDAKEYIEEDGKLCTSESNISRGISPFFCLGLAS